MPAARGISSAPERKACPAGVRFDADFGGRAAMVVRVRELGNDLVSVHGRCLKRSGTNRGRRIGIRSTAGVRQASPRTAAIAARANDGAYGNSGPEIRP
jgi:hypothetical protein